MKIRYALLFAGLLSGTAYGQCVPDPTITVPGYYPDSLPYAIVGTPYSADIQVLVPSTYSGFSVDSVNLDSISGMPPGFTYTCTPSSCSIAAMVNACVRITGPAFSAGAAGSIYPLTMNLRAYLHLGPFPIDTAQSVTQYAIVVDNPSGIASLSRAHFDASQAYPNPFSDVATLAYTLPVGGNVKVFVYNLLGSVISSRTMASKAGLNFMTLQAKDYAPGIYIVSLSDGQNTLTRRMVVKRP